LYAVQSHYFHADVTFKPLEKVSYIYRAHYVRHP